MLLRLPKHSLTIFIILLILLSSACTSESQPSPTVQPSPTAQAPTVAPDTPTPTQIPPTEIPPTPTITPAPNPCPKQQNLIPPNRQSFEQYPEVVRNYLAQGGNPGDLELFDWEGYLPADLTGDQVEEHIFIYIDPSASYYPPTSIMVIYQCSEGTVNILDIFEPQEWWGLELIDARDITHSGSLDLIFSEVTCGAHTCWHTVHVITWTGKEFTDSAGAEFSYPYPNYLYENDMLVVSSYGIGSAGAGPQRPVTTTLAWNGSVVTATNTTIGPAIIRFHAFVDGDTALKSGDIIDAKEAYLRVIMDAGLKSWGAFYDENEEFEWLHALSYWRLLNIYTLQDDFDNAEEQYEILRENASLDAIVYPVVRLSERFWQIIEAGDSVNYACSVIRAMPETLLVLDFLNSFGYANPHYTAENLCFSPSD